MKNKEYKTFKKLAERRTPEILTSSRLLYEKDRREKSALR